MFGLEAVAGTSIDRKISELTGGLSESATNQSDVLLQSKSWQGDG
jgi:hypothetical protein